MKYVIITGVSTGIGYSALENLVQSGYHVFGSVRNQQDADRLSQTFLDKFTPLFFDVTDEEAIIKSVEVVKSKLSPKDQLVALVNNSGIALGGPFKHLNTDIFRKQFEVNLFGVATVTREFLPLLGATKDSPYKGKVVMISSVSGKLFSEYLELIL